MNLNHHSITDRGYLRISWVLWAILGQPWTWDFLEGTSQGCPGYSGSPWTWDFIVSQRGDNWGYPWLSLLFWDTFFIVSQKGDISGCSGYSRIPWIWDFIGSQGGDFPGYLGLSWLFSDTLDMGFYSPRLSQPYTHRDTLLLGYPGPGTLEYQVALCMYIHVWLVPQNVSRCAENRLTWTLF